MPKKVTLILLSKYRVDLDGGCESWGLRFTVTSPELAGTGRYLMNSTEF